MAKSVKSVSVRKAQVPVSCYFCNGLGTQWKCEECDVFMCSSCKEKVHGNLKSCQSHDVVSIQDFSNEMSDAIEVSSEVIASIFNSYTISVPLVSCLACSNDDIVYILDNMSKECKFIKGKLLKASIRILESYSLPMFDFTLNRLDEVLFTNIYTEEESPVRMISSGEITTVLDPKPMRLLAIHVNKDDELICGLREPGPAFPVHNFSVRQVVIFGSDFSRKVTLENDTKGRKLFTAPYCVCTNAKNEIYVVNTENDDWTGTLLAVDRTGRLKFSYSGPSSIEEMRPVSLVVTQKDNIILLDCFNNALHALNSKGNLLALQFLTDLNIEAAGGISIDSEGFIIIGCGGEFEGDKNGKLYVTKMAGRFM